MPSNDYEGGKFDQIISQPTCSVVHDIGQQLINYCINFIMVNTNEQIPGSGRVTPIVVAEFHLTFYQTVGNLIASKVVSTRLNFDVDQWNLKKNIIIYFYYI